MDAVGIRNEELIRNCYEQMDAYMDEMEEADLHDYCAILDEAHIAAADALLDAMPAHPVHRIPPISVSAPVVSKARNVRYRATSTVTLQADLPAIRDSAGELLGYGEASGALLRPCHAWAIARGRFDDWTMISDEEARQEGIRLAVCTATADAAGDEELRNGCLWDLDARVETRLAPWFEPPYEAALGWTMPCGSVLRLVPALERIRNGVRLELISLEEGEAQGIRTFTWTDADVGRAEDLEWVDAGIERLIAAGGVPWQRTIQRVRWTFLAAACRAGTDPEYSEDVVQVMECAARGAAMEHTDPDAEAASR